MAETRTLSRRQFLVTGGAAAGGLLIGFHLPVNTPAAQAGTATRTTVNAWLRVGTDDSVTIMVPSSEMGQGVFSSLPALVAEELEVDWNQVRAETAPADRAYVNPIFGRQSTGGSTSVRAFFEPLRKVGATAREMLRQAAANRWGVPVTECVAQGGRISHEASGRTAGYGSLATDAAALEPMEDVPLKAPDDWRILGKPFPRLDTPAKVDGSAQFGMDVSLDGMLFGAVEACPVFGGTLKGVDEAPAREVAGVKTVVTLEEAVIVVAEHYWAAKKGLEALDPQWDFGANTGMSDESIAADFRAALDDDGVEAESDGDPDAALQSAAQSVEALYEAPYLAHATMEPMNATARVSGGRAEIWAPTQNPERARNTVAELLGLKLQDVEVYTTFLGGGFGRRGEVDFVRYAAQASKAVGAPVKAIWSREEDMRHDFYRPRAAARFTAGLDSGGSVTAWKGKLACQSILSRAFPEMVRNGIDFTSVGGAIGLPYAFGARRTDYVMTEAGVPVGFWRAPGSNQNGFFTESFMDELAHAAGQDPFEFRMALLAEEPRFQAVLQKAADLIGWGTPPPEGRHRGIALLKSHGSIVAEAAEISLSEDKRLTVHRVSCAVDCGRMVNPDTVRAQMEGGIVYGLTAVLFGRVTVKDGRIAEGNFDRYQMMQMAHMPEVEVAIIESGAEMGGIGEPSTPVIAPAVTNAIFAATGERIRSLPLSEHGITPA